MKLGTEDKKKTAAAVALTAVALITVYVQFFSGGSTTPPRGRPTPPRPAAAAPSPSTPAAGTAERRAVRRAAPRTTRRRNQGGDFEPIWRRSHEDEEFDPLEDDPTLKVALLNAVRDVGFSGIDRNIFEFTTRRRKVAPPPADLVERAQRQQDTFADRSTPNTPTATSKPAERRAPRLTWKYYGFAGEAGGGARRAFLLDGEDVLIAGENDTLKGGRYRIVRIGLTSIVIEDTEFKQEQSLQITAPRS